MEYIIDILSLIKVGFCFSLFYIFIPAFVLSFKEKTGMEDHSTTIDIAVRGFIEANFILIVLTHILSFLKIYETISLWAFYILIYYLLYRKYTKGKRIISKNNMNYVKPSVKMLELLDIDKSNAIDILKEKCLGALKSISILTVKLLKFIIKRPVFSVCIVFLIVIALKSRTRFLFNHYNFSEPDCYVHLAWSKYMGNNDMYGVEGIYPYGYEAVLSSINKFTLIDSYIISRYFGVLQGILIILSLIYTLYKNYGDEPYILLIPVYIYIVGAGLPMDIVRQSSAISQEYASIFIPLGIHFFNKFMATKNYKFLTISTEIVAIAMLIHFYIIICLCIAFAVIAFIYFENLIDLRLVIRTFVLMVLANLFGILPMVIGFIMGKPLHSTFAFVAKNATILKNIGFANKKTHTVTHSVVKEAVTKSTKIVNTKIVHHETHHNLISLIIHYKAYNSTLRLLFIICAIGIVIGSIIALINLIRRKNKNCRIDIVFCGTTLCYYILYYAHDFKIPTLMDQNRMGMFLSMIGLFPFTIIIRYIIKPFRINKLKKVLSITAFFFVIFVANKYTPPFNVMEECLEYSNTAKIYLKIKADSTPLQWDVVSPVEQYQQTLNYGWHTELSSFVKSLDKGAKGSVFTTPVIYLYTEKIPFGSKRPVNPKDEDRYLDPKIIGSADSSYRRVLPRITIEAKAYYWAERYMKKHKNMTVFYEDKLIKVYKIIQNPDKPIRLGYISKS